MLIIKKYKTYQKQQNNLVTMYSSIKSNIIFLTSKTGRSIRAFPEKWALKPLAKFPIA